MTDLLRSLVAGVDAPVPIGGGERVPYLNFDNAASTPPFKRVLAALESFAPWYASVHRGTGFKSRLATWAFEEARDVVGRFVGADPARSVVIFTRNTTEALNHLARRLQFEPGAVVLSTMMEHHSNDLPWRRVARTIHVRTLPNGRLDEQDLRDRLDEYRGRVALLAVSGASNVTGLVNPVHTYARWAHEAGARIVVDGAQLVPHRPVDVRAPGDPEHLDFLAFSAHKMYAPFGVGALVGPRETFTDGDPVEVGGGTVDSVSLDRVQWTAPPEREEAGTPCVIGAVALAAAIRTYGDIGWTRIAEREGALARHALRTLAWIPSLTIYGDADPTNERVGVVAFNVGTMPHGLVSAALGHEWGVGTRSGCFCAHPYVKTLLGIDDEASRLIEDRIAAGDRSDTPGAVRMSLGLYNTIEEVDRLAAALTDIAVRGPQCEYRVDPGTGEYLPLDGVSSFAEYCAL